METVKLEHYSGPFAGIRPLVWRDDVDRILADSVNEESVELVGEKENYNRFAVSRILDRTPATHGCKRDGCDGQRGGYWCPFTKRVVCLREDCSTAARAWIPDGADLCRVEAEFFEEFEPLLGL